MVTHMPSSLLEVLRRLAPGTELRNGIERIIQHGSGALVVLGGGAAVEDLCTGGFVLRDTSFTEQRLAELAKMDGAIILDASSERILRANVHLIPDATIPTRETGTRHRTAERMAIQTGTPMVSVSEGRKIAVVFTAEGRHELESPVTVLPRVNQVVQNLDRFRRRLDLAVEILTRQEVEGAATFRSVVSIIQRAEIIHRLGTEVDDLTVALGDEGTLIRFQAMDLLQGVDELATLVIADYSSRRGRRRRSTISPSCRLSISTTPSRSQRSSGSRTSTSEPRRPDIESSTGCRDFPPASRRRSSSTSAISPA